MFDAYTIKKVLPRLFAAIILIQLSWFIFTGMITITNAVAYGIEGIIYAPFGGAKALELQNILTTTNGGNGLFVGLTFAATAGVILAALAVGGIAATAGLVLLGVLIAFCLLLARQIIIVALLFVAPLALVAWILPGTEKYWKIWWESFFKLLLVYPMILALIATGRVLAVVVGGVDAGTGSVPIIGDIVQFFMLIACVFGPFFMIPKTFQMAGGAFAALTNAVNSKGAAGKNWLKKRRGQTWAKNWQKTQEGHRFNPEGRLGGLNRHIQTGAIVGTGKAGFSARRLGGRLQNARSTGEDHEAQELLAKNEHFQAHKADDDIMDSVIHARGRAAIEERLRNTDRYRDSSPTELAAAVAAVESVQKSGGREAVVAAAVQAKAESGTGYATAADAYREIMEVSEGDQQMRNRLLARVRSGSEKGRRPDIAAIGHVDSENIMRELVANPGMSNNDLNARVRQRSLEAAGPHQLLNGREEAVQQTMEQLGDDYIAARDGGDTERATELASQITSFRGAMGSAPPQNRAQVSEMLERVGVQQELVDPLTGAAYSTDDQLGMALAGYDVGHEVQVHEMLVEAKRQDIGPSQIPTAQVPNPPALTPEQRFNRDQLENLQAEATELQQSREKAAAQTLTQSVRTRAGLYDAGGGGRTPEQIRAAQSSDPNLT